ncbi:hypothetical protein FN846DRAFT_912516 [Sphaerosporella brunnea]|uniref:Uncharacterized protein n=1 Tax=Sphaerosporella brunnea TaxID=1250544 RepID=A0A5J5EIE4_9PEZI|nr:hypothetical protein FN846DRAFT_912516 [Sphaerosporella brunnea]
MSAPNDHLSHLYPQRPSFPSLPPTTIFPISTPNDHLSHLYPQRLSFPSLPPTTIFHISTPKRPSLPPNNHLYPETTISTTKRPSLRFPTSLPQSKPISYYDLHVFGSVSGESDEDENGSALGESDEDENGSALGESDEDENGSALGESDADENGSEEHGANESFCDIDDDRFYGDNTSVGSVSGESGEDENGLTLGESDEDENGSEEHGANESFCDIDDARFYGDNTSVGSVSGESGEDENGLTLGESDEDENGSEEHGADESFCDIDDARFYGDSPVPARSPVPEACVLDLQVGSVSGESDEDKNGSALGESDEHENGSALGESDEDENGSALGESDADENGSEEHGADESFCDIDDARFYGDSPVPARSPVPDACVLDLQVLSPSLESLERTVYVSGNGELHPKATEVLLDWVAVTLALVLFRFESGRVRVEGQEVFQFVDLDECPVALELMDKLAEEMMCFLILNFNSIWDCEPSGYTN